MPREPHGPHTAWNPVLWKPKVPQTGQDRKGVPRQEGSSHGWRELQNLLPMFVFSPLTQQRCPSYSKLTESIRKHAREWPRVAADPREGFSNAGVLRGPGWQLCNRKQILCSQSWDLLPLQVTWEEPRWWYGASATARGDRELGALGQWRSTQHWPAHPVSCSWWTDLQRPFSSSTLGLSPCGLWAQVSGESLAPEERIDLTAVALFLGFPGLLGPCELS